MLKITNEPNARFRTFLRLEGKLSGPWVESLAQLCASPDSATPIGIDMTSVQYVDEAGLRLLQNLLRQGVRIASASGFVNELLQLENR